LPNRLILVGFFIKIFVILTACGLGLALSRPGVAGDCGPLVFDYQPPTYYGYGEYFAECPDGARIRCYHYHWDWICEKGETLSWDRRLEAAAHAACGCPMPEGVAPASPFTSGRPRPGIFGPGE